DAVFVALQIVSRLRAQNVFSFVLTGADTDTEKRRRVLGVHSFAEIFVYHIVSNCKPGTYPENFLPEFHKAFTAFVKYDFDSSQVRLGDVLPKAHQIEHVRMVLGQLVEAEGGLGRFLVKERGFPEAYGLLQQVRQMEFIATLEKERMNPEWKALGVEYASVAISSCAREWLISEAVVGEFGTIKRPEDEVVAKVQERLTLIGRIAGESLANVMRIRRTIEGLRDAVTREDKHPSNVSHAIADVVFPIIWRENPEPWAEDLECALAKDPKIVRSAMATVGLAMAVRILARLKDLKQFDAELKEVENRIFRKVAEWPEYYDAETVLRRSSDWNLWLAHLRQFIPGHDGETRARMELMLGVVFPDRLLRYQREFEHGFQWYESEGRPSWSLGPLGFMGRLVESEISAREILKPDDFSEEGFQIYPMATIVIGGIVLTTRS
ncbi:MAG: hypothetical protein ABSF76_15685, partial [Opitutaceae bacterium]